MEPMTLGSPSTLNQYLPAFLLGEQTPKLVPQKNYVSSNENLCFASSRTLSNQNIKQQRSNNSLSQQEHASPNLKNCLGGPPVMDLYDDMPQANSLSTSKVYTTNPTSPTKIINNSGQQTFYGSPTTNFNYLNDFDLKNSSHASNLFKSPEGIHLEEHQRRNIAQGNISFNGSYNSPKPREGEFWVTVLGFPSELAHSVIEFFKRCGVVKDIKIIPCSNYLNIRYTSRFERQEALSFNGKMFCQSIMLGVIPCHNPGIVSYEHLNTSDGNMDLQCKLDKIKMLTSPKSASKSQILMDNYRQNQLRGTSTQNRPASRPEGVLTRAMEYFFGW